MNLVTPDFGIIFWQSLTFLLVVLILGKFAWKPILQVLGERETYIQQSLASAQEAKQLLAQVKMEQAQLLEHSNREREKLINEALASKNAIVEAARVEAIQVTEKVMETSRQAIATERQVAFDKLKGELLFLSVQVAEKLLVKELDTQNKQEDLVRRLIKETPLN